MTEITFEKLITETNRVIYEILRNNIPKDKVKHICDGVPIELKNHAEYPFVIIDTAQSDDDITTHNINYNTLNDLTIDTPIDIYTTSAKKMRELIDLIKYTLVNNRSSTATYGLSSPTFTSTPSDPSNMPDNSDRVEYKTTITVSYSWGGSQV